MSEVNLTLFDFSGFAAKNDLQNKDWKVVFDSLEEKQKDFIKFENEFRSEDYRWPRDPLHTWSRLWEYPYVYHHIHMLRKQHLDRKLQVLDYGSGVTFFPFAIAQLGCDVICTDIDPIVAEDIPKAKKVIEHKSGNVDVALICGGSVPVESESQDVVYCISVLEHIPQFDSVIDEMVRVLRPGGCLILTVDIDLRGNLELSVDEYEHLLVKLDERFVRCLPEKPVHPRNLLTTTNSPYRVYSKSMLSTIKQVIKNILTGKLFNGDPRVGAYLGVYSIVLIKK